MMQLSIGFFNLANNLLTAPLLFLECRVEREEALSGANQSHHVSSGLHFNGGIVDEGANVGTSTTFNIW